MDKPLIAEAPRQSANSKLSKNFGLSEAQFVEVLYKLKQGDETLFERVFLAQFEDCMRYLMNRHKISRSVAYDASMEALLKFRKRLLAGKITYGNMRYLFTRMASQFLIEAAKHPTTMLSELEETPEEVASLDKEILDALDRAWAQLCQECRKILGDFYYQKIALKTIATNSGKSEAAIRKQKQRCLEKLRKHFLTFQ